MKRDQQPKSELELEMQALFEETFKLARSQNNPELLKEKGFILNPKLNLLAATEYILLIDPLAKKTVTQLVGEMGSIPKTLLDITGFFSDGGNKDKPELEIGAGLTRIFELEESKFELLKHFLKLEGFDNLKLFKFKDPTPFLQRFSDDLRFLSS